MIGYGFYLRELQCLGYYIVPPRGDYSIDDQVVGQYLEFELGRESVPRGGLGQLLSLGLLNRNQYICWN